MIAGTGSNSGKTTITTALLKAFGDTGKKVASYKAGPDYIDPMFHSQVVGVTSRNLDKFMLGENKCKYVLCQNSQDKDISIIEGVMGYYDGIGTNTSGSSYELASVLNCPVVLVVSCEGMAVSLSAIIEGFKNFRDDSNIKGVILNNISSRMYEYYKKIVEDNTGVKVYGYMPHMEGCKLESRHLGLVTAEEIGNIKSIVEDLGQCAMQNIDIDELYQLAKTAHPIGYEDVDLQKIGNVRIAVAKDKAFCFYYEDSLNVLKSLGADIVEFSPLKDIKLPENIDGLYIGGGYPELNIDKLSSNENMLRDIKRKILEGIPTFAECGGYMYLLEQFGDDTLNKHNMVGAIIGQSFMTKSLKRFGYVTLTAQKDNIMCKKGESINAHEFHYSDSTNIGDSFVARKPESDKHWDCIISDETKFMGYPHIHLLSNVEFAVNFVKGCVAYKDACKKKHM